MIKIQTRLYLYDSFKESDNYRGRDFSAHIIQGDSDTDDLTEVLDVVELTLAGLNFSEEFAPKTKFIYEKWELLDDANYVMYKDWHLIVADDVVSQPILSDDHYFDHHITFNEASADGQGRTVDNIAVTYKLKDVSLDSRSSLEVEVDALAQYPFKPYNIELQPERDFEVNNFIIGVRTTRGHSFEWELPTWYTDPETGRTPLQLWNNFLKYQIIPEGQNERIIKIPVPMLKIRQGINGSKNYRDVGYCSVAVYIQEYDQNKEPPEEISLDNPSYVVNPNSNDPIENIWNYVHDKPPATLKGTIFQRYITKHAIQTETYKRVSKYDNEYNNRFIPVVIKKNCIYNIKFGLFNFTGSEVENVGGTSTPATLMYTQYGGRYNVRWVTLGSLSAGIQFYAETLENGGIFLKSAIPANAYDLYNKAFMTTQNFEKIDGIPCNDMTSEQRGKASYCVSDADKAMMEATVITENFYNRKNWWEMQLDIGKFFHSIPKVRFGSDDRFITTWRKLGDTQQRLESGEKINIFNSRQIDEYIAACSSYVTNCVQIGGRIRETIAPKSSSEDYLVYNDVAELHTSRAIIEIEDLEVKYIGDSYGLISNGEIRNLTKYIFAKEVYNVFSISPSMRPNKGIAIYYEQGSNIIKGLNYRLPAMNVGDKQGDYSIKRILGEVYSIFNYGDIKVNDFIFTITYKTRDDIRVDQSRPDLRKYLLASKYDRVPQHYQFNNQEDIVVDSEKFGNNVYGKLIRTGNTNYTVLEWHDTLFAIKQSGELYNVRGDLYYVSKVKNTYFHDHIISEVEFSKNFNRLSQMIGIPSEPRFYEISEQSQIRRDIAINDYLILDTKQHFGKAYLNPMGYEYFISGRMFGRNWITYSKGGFYAITTFKNDQDKNQSVIGNEFFWKETMHAISVNAMQNTLVMSWRMADNFSAGDQVSETETTPKDFVESTLDSIVNFISNKQSLNQVTSAYRKLLPYQYKDVHGRADLIEFALVTGLTMTSNNATRNLPQPYVSATAGEGNRYLCGNQILYHEPNHENSIKRDQENKSGIIALLDNREVASFNYNLQLLTGSDRFVLSGYLWREKTEYVDGGHTPTPLRLVLLTDEVNKVINNTISAYTISEYSAPLTVYASPFPFNDFDTPRRVRIPVYDTLIESFEYQEIEQKIYDGVIKSIAIISDVRVSNNSYLDERYFIMARNISGLDPEEALADWYISPFDKNICPKQ